MGYDDFPLREKGQRRDKPLFGVVNPGGVERESDLRAKGSQVIVYSKVYDGVHTGGAYRYQLCEVLTATHRVPAARNVPEVAGPGRDADGPDFDPWIYQRYDVKAIKR